MLNEENGKKDKPTNGNCLVVASDYSDSPTNAELQRLISKVHTLNNGASRQVVMITSAVMGEGKSTISSRLAVVAARNLSAPTLLVDTDLRHPSVHKIFGINPRFGIADYLERDVPLEECVHVLLKSPDMMPNLRLLTRGNMKNNPLESMTLEKMTKLLQELRRRYDFVVLDTAPIIPVSDALILGQLVDTVIMVVKVGDTSKKLVKRAIEMMKKQNIDIRGLILNNVNDILPYYYNYDFYNYNYYSFERD